MTQLSTVIDFQKLDIEEKGQLLNYIYSINDKKVDPIDLLNYMNYLKHLVYDNSLNELKLQKYLIDTGLIYILSYSIVKDEIVEYLINAEDPKVRDEWNKQDIYTLDKFIKTNFLPMDNRSGYYFADMRYIKKNKPYGYVQRFEIQNFTLNIKKIIWKRVKESLGHDFK